jgi:hypothetical protein
MLLVSGRINTREQEKPKLIGDQVTALENIFEQRDALLEVFVNGKLEASLFGRLKEILERSPGRVGVVVKLVSGSQLFSLAIKGLRVMPNAKLVEQLGELVGKQNLTFRELRRK